MLRKGRVRFDIFSFVIAILIALTFMAMSLRTMSLMLRLMFVTGITIVNRSGEEVSVSCLGVLQSKGASGEKVVSGLPLYRERKFMTFKWAAYLGGAVGITLAPGERKTLHYDYDDINFCWILIRGESGNYKVIRTGLSDDPAHCCSKPMKKRSSSLLCQRFQMHRGN